MADDEVIHANVDLAELALIIMEQIVGEKRPPGATGVQFMLHVKTVNAREHDKFLRAAHAAAHYMAANLQQALDLAKVQGRPN